MVVARTEVRAVYCQYVGQKSISALKDAMDNESMDVTELCLLLMAMYENDEHGIMLRWCAEVRTACFVACLDQRWIAL